MASRRVLRSNERKLLLGFLYALAAAMGLLLGAFGVLDSIGVLFWIVVCTIWLTGMAIAPGATGNITVLSVVSIVLVTVVLAALVQARDRARRVTTMDRLRQVQKAQHDRNRFYNGGKYGGPLGASAEQSPFHPARDIAPEDAVQPESAPESESRDSSAQRVSAPSSTQTEGP